MTIATATRSPNTMRPTVSSRSIRRRAVVALAVVALMLGAAACNDDGGGGGGEPTPGTTVPMR